MMGFDDLSTEAVHVLDNLPNDLAALGPALRALKRLRSSLSIIEDDLSARIAELIPRPTRTGRRIPPRQAVVEGLGVLQVKPSSERKAWDHDKLLALVVARGRDERRIDQETGEALESEVDAVVRAIQECAGIRDWKVTGLKARGIDPDEFCVKSYGPDKVIL